MADDFYTLEEALAKLALTEDQVSGLVREGRIREFRVEGKRKFKKSEVDELAAEINPALGSTAAGGSESAIELLPVDSTDGGSDVVALDESSDQTSGSGVQQAPTVKPKGEDTVITPAGVSVFDEDELAGMDADPMAKTQIAPSVSDELAVEGTGSSGSGLLDLSREQDDTSLGGVLDEIYSGEETMPETKAPAEEPAGFEHVEEPAVTAAPAAVRAAAYEVEDPLAGIFNGVLVAALILLGFTGVVIAGLVAGVLPGFIQVLASSILYPVIGAVVVTAVSIAVGYVLGRR